MTTVAEAIAQGSTQVSDVLDAGIEQISQQQQVVFTKYLRVRLPIDGSVFWVRADLLGAVAMANGSQVGPNPVPPTATLTVKGSLHRATDQRQEEDQTVSVDMIVFTSEQEIQSLSEISPVVMWLGEFEGVRFAFNRRNSYYRQANKHHYVGEALFAQFKTQIIDSVSNINQRRVVSNSLPVWLGIDAGFPVFSSFLVPPNELPPYAVAHILPDSVEAIQAAPYEDEHGSTWQLVRERVKITLVGCRNDQAMDFRKRIMAMAGDDDADVGIMTIPVIRDEKRQQKEITSLAIVKTITFDVNYYQTRMDDIVRQRITKAIPTYNPQN